MNLPDGFSKPFVCMPGILAVSGPPIEPRPSLDVMDENAIWHSTKHAHWTR